MTDEHVNKKFFTDEKIFKFQLHHTQNDSVYAVNRNDLSNERLNVGRISSQLKLWSQ